MIRARTGMILALMVMIRNNEDVSCTAKMRLLTSVVGICVSKIIYFWRTNQVTKNIQSLTVFFIEKFIYSNCRDM